MTLENLNGIKLEPIEKIEILDLLHLQSIGFAGKTVSAYWEKYGSRHVANKFLRLYDVFQMARESVKSEPGVNVNKEVSIKVHKFIKGNC